MAFTTHGHHIPGTSYYEVEEPKNIHRCGGLTRCSQCATEAAAAQKETVFNVDDEKPWYPKPSLNKEELTKRFGLHKAAIEGENALRMEHATLRTEFMDFAVFLNNYLPEGRNKSLVMTELETASMWAHKALANDTDG